ncbi:carboxypeptidase-like regulatory domain-containing protein [Aequorivita xiaoshiensis]|uniref:Carboxypeptidase-like regulatory domain-containing protein n=1 Tax=Aequorivita xiaoshiensis TaxID=2874476 RepID=A0A9X1U3T6_9FLAO|nr:carboxypeptidase-like regulatory domain-containing protein [Aequorivita xiaoshiensis]MCG2431189.1 carboxypeptidase-like regulatory domain-containing protein [Aequorivita xiaoshiensis]
MSGIFKIHHATKTKTIFRCLTLLLGILFSSSLYSQRQQLEGSINAVDDIDVEGVNIFNISTNKGTVTDANGKFLISVREKDTLSVSAIHIQTTTLIIGAEQMTNKKIIIHLNEKMNELGTVTLRKPLTGYIGSDAKIIPIHEIITATSMGLPNADRPKLTKTQRQLYAANSGPVDALVNMISGRTKMLKKHLEFDKTSALTLTLLDKFPETYFTDELKIEKLKIYSFIFFCEADPDYQTTLKKSTIEITDFLKRKSSEFKNQ